MRDSGLLSGRVFTVADGDANGDATSQNPATGNGVEPMAITCRSPVHPHACGERSPSQLVDLRGIGMAEPRLHARG